MTATDYEKAVDSLGKDMRELRADLKAVVSAIRVGARERVASVKENLSDAADERIEQLRQAAQKLRIGGQQAVEKGRQTVAEHPLVSVLAALGVGMLIGGLIRRARR